MSRQDSNIRVNEKVNEKKIDPVQIAIEQTDVRLMEIASNLDLIEQDTQKAALTSEDKIDVIEQVDAEHHQVFLAMNTIRGVDIDDFCSNNNNAIKTTKWAGKIPPLSIEAFEALKQSIKEIGHLYIPISINEKGEVLDGHHRLKACQELGIKPTFKVEHFNSELEEELYVIRINRIRRQLNTWQQVELAIQESDKLAELAKRNMKAGKTLSCNQERVHLDAGAAKLSGYSKDTIHKVRYVNKVAKETPDKQLGVDYDGRYRGKAGPTYAQILEDAREGKLTHSKASSLIKRDKDIITKRAELEAAARTLALPEKVTLLNRDSTKLEDIPELKDNSIDLIVTDPPYTKEYLYVFEGLAKMAYVKLKPGGSLVFNYGNHLEIDIHKIFEKYNDKLTFWWRFCVFHEGAQTVQMYTKGVKVSWKPMMWFVKKGRRRLTGYNISDFIPSTKPDKTQHPWAQSSAESEYLVKYLTESENSLVVDPFLGSGAYAIPPIKMGRYFVGIEIDKQVYETARNYLIKEAGAPNGKKGKKKEGED